MKDIRFLNDNDIKYYSIIFLKRDLGDPKFKELATRIIKDLDQITYLTNRQRNCLLGFIRKDYHLLNNKNNFHDKHHDESNTSSKDNTIGRKRKIFILENS